MKLRYQMRGLGIGIIVTALLMGVVKGEKLPLSDAEIKARASELGMVESDSLRLSDVSNVAASSEGLNDPDGESKASGENGSLPEGDEESSKGEGISDPGSGGGSGEAADPGGMDSTGGNADPDGNSGEEQSGTPDMDQETADPASGTEGGESQSSGADGDMVTVVIEEGVTSYSVCLLLEELGLIEDADSLDYYICSNSYSRSIQQGVYEIRKGTEPEEIVRIIMGNR